MTGVCVAIDTAGLDRGAVYHQPVEMDTVYVMLYTWIH